MFMKNVLPSDDCLLDCTCDYLLNVYCQKKEENKDMNLYSLLLHFGPFKSYLENSSHVGEKRLPSEL